MIHAYMLAHEINSCNLNPGRPSYRHAMYDLHGFYFLLFCQRVTELIPYTYLNGMIYMFVL